MGKKTLRDVVGEWPPGAWYRSYSHSDQLLPDLENATIKSVSRRDDEVNLTIESNGEFSSTFPVVDEDKRRRVLEILSDAKGQKLVSVGDSEI